MRQETDIGKLVQDTLRTMAIPPSVRVDLRIALADGQMQIDGEAIARLIEDLVTNACEAMPQGGDLTIGIDGDDEGITLVVADQGRGMTPEVQDQLFTPFFSTKPAGQGTGLGLPSVYATVRGHGGRVAVTSNADQEQGPTGTEVRITLPRRPPWQGPATRLVLHDD